MYTYYIYICIMYTYYLYICIMYISRRCKRPGNEKRKKIKKIVPVPIYVFVDSEQKAEFKAKIKPCSHQLNCMKFL